MPDFKLIKPPRFHSIQFSTNTITKGEIHKATFALRATHRKLEV
jgi:hypothetical protein